MQGECPYCGCDSLTPLFLKRMRLGAVALAGIGFLFLCLMSYSRELPLVTAGRVNPMMNSARVRVAGVVESRAYVSKKDGVVDYLSFYVNDGTGSMRVSAYSDIACALTNEGKLPEKGDNVEVSGSLRIVFGKPATLRLERAGVIWK